MNHKPSTYTGNITLTVQQMMEVHKAIRARLVFLITEADDHHYPHKQQDIQDLLAVGQLLDDHETRAVTEWEDRIAHTEANELNNEEALRRFMNGK